MQQQQQHENTQNLKSEWKWIGLQLYHDSAGGADGSVSGSLFTVWIQTTMSEETLVQVNNGKSSSQIQEELVEFIAIWCIINHREHVGKMSGDNEGKVHSCELKNSVSLLSRLDGNY